jgi:hypothetical protein
VHSKVVPREYYSICFFSLRYFFSKKASSANLCHYGLSEKRHPDWISVVAEMIIRDFGIFPPWELAIQFVRLAASCSDAYRHAVDRIFFFEQIGGFFSCTRYIRSPLDNLLLKPDIAQLMSGSDSHLAFHSFNSAWVSHVSAKVFGGESTSSNCALCRSCWQS